VGGGSGVRRACAASILAAAALVPTGLRPRGDTAAATSPAPATWLELDGSTGTVRVLADLDGYLTGRSDRPARRVAMGYVRSHHEALGLTATDLDTFHLRRDYRDIEGIHHLSWVQRIDGERVFGHGLQAAVARGGRLLMVGGSPVSGAAAPPARPPHPGFRPRRPAKPVLFVSDSGTRRAWQVLELAGRSPAVSVRDADSGAVLDRRPLEADRAAPEGSSGRAVAYFPGHRPGGRAVTVPYSRRGWLAPDATRLSGNNVHAWSDVDDDDRPQRSEEAPPSSGHRWDHTLEPFHPATAREFCGHPYPCSWHPDRPYSWRVNREQTLAQVFFFVNTWHDHLARAPIGFTEAAGNFEHRNRSGHGRGGDAVQAQAADGADTDHGLPDDRHVDRAGMTTPPDGHAPRLELSLQHRPGASYPSGDPFAPTDAGDQADTVYHEYTHGLSHRLVVDPTGLAALTGVQAGALGEGWSDWYAMDYLVDKGLQRDRSGTADVVLFQYAGAAAALERTEPLDCWVGAPGRRCPGGETGHRGGYTYADLGRVAGHPEVHADGEIWAQTLWSLRGRLGSRTSESLVTRAMELAPANPSFLDLRNAMLLADTAVFAGRHHDAIWTTFASRGMGFHAGSLGGDDATPSAGSDLPPADTRAGTIAGVVRDRATGDPVPGLPVTLAFQGGAGVANPTAVTGPDGSYTIGPVPLGRYGKLLAAGAAYAPVRRAVTVGPDGTTADFLVDRRTSH
jgi:hypothetical protein